ncbi:MAG: hypothetical protein IJL53_11635 [Firmicutes bacterium]|nr:hypothetical protein [Bacillota bacterium]
MKKKTTKTLSLMLCICLLLVCCSCISPDKEADAGSSVPKEESAPGESSSEASAKPEESSEASSGSDTVPAEPDADTAMSNFVAKLDAGNYVIDHEDSVKTTVFSPERIFFTEDNDSSSSINLGYVTLDNETFLVELNDISDVEFVAPGNAIEALGSILPNDWYAYSGENMFNLFYNNVDNPLEFTSNDEAVKLTLLRLGGYSEQAVSVMEEVHMLLDAEDPSSVRFTAVMGQYGMIKYDDLDVTLQFGVGENDPRIDKWFANPIYPPTRTAWTWNDVADLDLVFERGYGEDAVPFPEFASYALIFDPHAYEQQTIVRIMDAHGTEADLEAYKAALLAKGYEAVEATFSDGSTDTVYRLLLREAYHSYAELYPYYDNGFVLEGGLYYDNPVYEGLPAISDAVAKNGFPELAETDLFKEWKATDTAASRSEGWAYFFDYDLLISMTLEYDEENEADAVAYFEEYSDRLAEAGFHSEYVPEEIGGKYESSNDFTSFRYAFNEDGTVSVEFKKEKSLTPDEVKALLAEHGIPVADIHGDIACRDQTRYRYIIGEFKGIFLFVYQPFDTREEAESFLDDYTAVLDEEGYLPMDPQKLGSQRTFLFFNEDLGKYVAFDLFDDGDGATAAFEFVSIEPDEETTLQSVLRH